MGKVPTVYSDSEETDTSSSVEVLKKKRFSILKYTRNNVKKKKCKIHSRSEPEEGEAPRSPRAPGAPRAPPAPRVPRAPRAAAGGERVRRLRGILKHSRDRESSMSEEEESDAAPAQRPQSRCLVGRVPRPAGAKPGRGGGVAIVIRKDMSATLPQQSGAKRSRRLMRKRSY